MNFKVLISKAVFEELNAAAIYYEEKQVNLGIEFVADWKLSIQILGRDPGIYQKKYKNFRSIKFSRFPFLIIFEIEGDEIFVYRVIHAKRKPGKMFKKPI